MLVLYIPICVLPVVLLFIDDPAMVPHSCAGRGRWEAHKFNSNEKWPA